jgi:hypothetical protein
VPSWSRLCLAPANPEDLCIAKATIAFIHGHFKENEIAYLLFFWLV